MNFLVVAYDISDDRRRSKVAKILEGHGTRCNYSVFECVLTESNIKKLKSKLKKYCDRETDSILYYYLCKVCIGNKEYQGIAPPSHHGIVIV
jgi:CRISPR-associated protein Cas2